MMKFSERFRVKPGSKVRLADWDPDDTTGFRDKKSVRSKTEKSLERLSELQYVLYAENKRSVLIVLQAPDAGGKDGTIRHVLGPLNPQSCKVIPFKTPTEEELAHDFLWRIHRASPRKGEIRIFNRSHYEDVLIVRVHDLVPKSVWSKRYEQINAFEQILARNGTHILKFYLHISPGRAVGPIQSPSGRPDEALESQSSRLRGEKALARLHAGLRGGAEQV